MSYSLSCKGIDKLEKELLRLNEVRFDGVAEKCITEMHERATVKINPAEGGTPVSTEKTRPGGPHGELRKGIKTVPDKPSTNIAGNAERVSAFDAEIGYTSEYAPHVEYGHRTRNGGFVPGQKFLYHNLDIQRSAYAEYLKEAIKKG